MALILYFGVWYRSFWSEGPKLKTLGLKICLGWNMGFLQYYDLLSTSTIWIIQIFQPRIIQIVDEGSLLQVTSYKLPSPQT